jgi:hypothetical protein
MGGQPHGMYIIDGACRSCRERLALAGDGRGRALCGACLRAVDADVAQKRAILLPDARGADVLTALA